MTQDIPFFAWGIAAAFATALVLSAISAALGRNGEAATSPRWGATAGLGLGYAIGHVLIQMLSAGKTPRDIQAAFVGWTRDGGPFPFFASDAFDWLPWLAIAATVIGVLDGWKPAPSWGKWENRLGLTALALGLLLTPLFGGTWEPGQGARWLLGLGVAMLASWALLDARAARLGSGLPWVFMLLAAGASVTLVLSYLALFAFFAASLSAASGALWLVSLFNRRMTLARGAVPVFATVYSGLLLVGSFYGDLPRASALALAAAPLATYVDRIGPVSRMSPWKASAIRTAALLVPLGIAIGVAFAMRHPEADSGGY